MASLAARWAAYGRRKPPPIAAPFGAGTSGAALLPEYPDARISVEVAWGADLTADPATWSWTDVTRKVRTFPGISTRLGRGDESSTTNPAEMSVVLDNTTGAFSLGGRSPNYPNVKRNVPVRVRVDPGTGARVLFLGFSTGWTPGWDDVSGTIPVVTCAASGTLRRLQQGAEPVISPVRRFFEADSFVTAYWSCEVGEHASDLPASFGGGNITWTGTADLAADSSYVASNPLPQTNASALYRAQVTPYTVAANNTQSVRFLLTIPSGGLPNNTVILSIIPTGGNVSRMDLVYSTGQVLTFKAYDSAGVAVVTDGPTVFSIDGDPGMMSLEFAQSGSTLFLNTKFLGVGADNYGLSGGASGTATVGTVSEVWIDPYQVADGVTFGHLAVLTAGSFQDDLSLAINIVSGYDGEGITGTGGSGRLSRVTTENGIQLAFYSGTPDTGTFADAAGPQPIDTVVNILRECERVERGVLWDGLDAGLAYTTRRRHENATPAFTINAASGELSPPFGPTDDDQRTRNRWTVSRKNGAEFTVSDDTGPMGTREVGTYSDSAELVVYQDRGARDVADWLVHAGTVQGYRYPVVTLDLRAVPRLVPLVLDLIVGSRIDITGVDDALDTGTPGTVSLTVEGIAHDIGPGDHWVVTLNCSPFEVWRTTELADDLGDTDEGVARLDAVEGDSALDTFAAAGSTSLSVATVATGALWTTAADDFPLWLDVGGEPVRATACSGASSPQTLTIDPLEVDRHVGDVVTVLNPNVLGL